MQNGVCDQCVSHALRLSSGFASETAAELCRAKGSDLSPHECDDTLDCQCGCNWLTPGQANQKLWESPWKPVTECPSCGGWTIRLNVETEQGKCLGCNSVWGGANFWKPLPILGAKD